MAKEGQELGFESTELRLGQPGNMNTTSGIVVKKENKRMFSGSDDDDVSKKQLVGWPPVCAYRRKNSFNCHMMKESKILYVKVSMDGAPFLRKIDLSGHKGYNELTLAFESLFSCYGNKIGSNSSDYIIIYQDKDGDWMLVGDVPWGMFVESCKRLRIMKKSDARGFGLHLKIFIKAASVDDQ